MISYVSLVYTSKTHFIQTKNLSLKRGKLELRSFGSAAFAAERSLATKICSLAQWQLSSNFCNLKKYRCLWYFLNNMQCTTYVQCAVVQNCLQFPKRSLFFYKSAVFKSSKFCNILNQVFDHMHIVILEN